jgi:hypothetical protein
MKKILLPLLVILITLVVSAPTFGQQAEDPVRKLSVPPLVIGNEIYEPHGRMRLGPFRFHPFLSEQFGYDSNILMTESKPIDEFPLISEIGARFDLANRNQLFFTGYRL